MTSSDLPEEGRAILFTCLCPNPVCKVRNEVYDEYDNLCFNCGGWMFPNPREALANRYEAAAGDGTGSEVILFVGVALSVFLLLGLPIVLWVVSEGVARGRLRRRAVQLRKGSKPLEPRSVAYPDDPVPPRDSMLVRLADVFGWAYWVLWAPTLLLTTGFEKFFLLFIPLSVWAAWKLGKAIPRLSAR